MQLNEQDIRKIVRRLIKEAGVLPPGEAPAKKQLHIFDFDDTLGITQNANGVMLYRDGKPAHKSADELKQWLQKHNVTQKDILEPGIKKIDKRDGFAAYLSSAGLAKIQKNTPRDKQGAVGQNTEDNAYKDGDNLLIDFTPSSGTDTKNTKPIKNTITRIRNANRAGAKTAVVTARKADGDGVDFDGNIVPATNAKDMSSWLAKYGAKPTDGVIGVTGKNKGKAIIDIFVKNSDNEPDEIHFYDDLKKNTDEVTDAITQDLPDKDLYVYGPGEFSHNEADPKHPTTVIDAKDKDKETKNESRRRTTDSAFQRWMRIAGIK